MRTRRRRRRHAAYVALWLACVTALFAFPLRAVAATTAECPRGSLVPKTPPGAGWAPLTDGVLAREGAPWPKPDVVAVVRGRLEFDLTRTVTLRRLFLQSDADQTVHVELSEDGQGWTRLVVPPHDTLSGMLSRSMNLPDLVARHVRVSAPDGISPITLGELGLYCHPEDGARRAFRVADEWPVEATSVWGRFSNAHPVSPTADDAVKLAVVLFTALGIIVSLRRRSRALDAALVALAVVAALAYTNFGSYRYPDFLHEHDVFHYFVGAKYFPELGYDGLYECAAVAEADAGFRQRVEARAQRDLRTNRLVDGAEALAHANECRGRFSAARWGAFASDVQYFVESRTVEDWHRILKDHGFNASPTWIAFGKLIATPLPAAAWSIGRGDSLLGGVIGPLDPLLLFVALGAVAWAFGAPVAALAVVVFACNPLSEYSWVGGGFLRELWVSSLVVGLCFLKKERPVVAGVFLAVSALLQLFPGACLFALAVSLAVDAAMRRSLDRQSIRVLAAAAVTLALLVPLSTVMAGRSGAWTAFAANTEKHASTPSGNLVGLPTALSFRMSTRASVLFDENATDPFARVRQARHDNLSPLRPLQLVAVALGLFGLYRCFRRRPEPWFAAVLGLALVPLVIETSGYYTAWLAALALAAARRRKLALPVLGVVAASLGLLLSLDELDVSSAFASYALVVGAGLVLALSLSAHGEAVPGPEIQADQA
ncbi:MAG TPA: hypothetical protein VH062_04610 [Polyangiaceae bacterium]|jgi:hypothetical protein|nr:hypothetical protein [Polyangiaceae bacterium]